MSIRELASTSGIGNRRAVRIQKAIELGQHLLNEVAARPKICSPSDVAELTKDMRFLDQEQLRVVLLSTKNDVIGIVGIYIGTVDQASVRVAEVLRPAVLRNAPSIIVVHNHPSGDPTPSKEDILLTRQIKQAAKLFDIDLLDHVIVAMNGFKSLKEAATL